MSALNESIINAEVSNQATTTVVVITGSTALAVGVAIASNMINSRSSAGIDFDSTGYYTPATAPSSFQTGDRIQVAPGKVYEFIGHEPARPRRRDYATDPDFLLVSSVTAGGSLDVHAEDAA